MDMVNDVVWVTLAIDPVKQEITIVGFTNDENELKEHRERVDSCYIRSFITSDGLGKKVVEWFTECGMPFKEAVANARNTLQNILDMSQGK